MGKRSEARAYIFPTTTLQIPALWPTGAEELSGSDPWAGPLWPEPVLRTRAAFLLRTDRSTKESESKETIPCTCLYFSLHIHRIHIQCHLGKWKRRSFTATLFFFIKIPNLGAILWAYQPQMFLKRFETWLLVLGVHLLFSIGTTRPQA